MKLKITHGDCKEMSCLADCKRNHTCKTFSCPLCEEKQPQRSIEETLNHTWNAEFLSLWPTKHDHIPMKMFIQRLIETERTHSHNTMKELVGRILKVIGKDEHWNRLQILSIAKDYNIEIEQV